MLSLVNVDGYHEILSQVQVGWRMRFSFLFFDMKSCMSVSGKCGPQVIMESDGVERGDD